MTEKIDGWFVSVAVNGKDILTIGDNYLAGSENTEEFAPIVRACSAHLLSFIGEGPDHVGNHIALAARATAEQIRDSVIDQCAAICQRLATEALDNYTTEAGRTAAHGALICAMGAIRNLKSQQDAAIEAKPAEQSAPFGEMETMKRLELANAQLSQQVQMLKRTASGPELLERLAASQEPLGAEFSDVLEKNLWDLYSQSSEHSEIPKSGRVHALKECAALCDAWANGFVSDINPNYSPDAAKGARTCATAIYELIAKAGK